MVAFLRSVLVALLFGAPLASGSMAAAAVPGGEPHGSVAVRFSDLAELTPANVWGLLPLISSTMPAASESQGALLQQRSSAHGLQLDSLAAVDLSLQRFLDERAHLQLATEEPVQVAAAAGAHGGEINYVIGAPPAAAPGESELRAWDSNARRLIWSVREAQPISPRALVTAGGLVFYGTADGWLKALDARSGRTLWQHRTEGRKLDEPFSYRGTDGHQYIAVHSLPQGAAGRETLLIFTLAH